ncbi:LptF/LptG family permease [Litorimonas haliclonae]|uniref:LptF/LptG family permease n=1 Tax=Litorimonas haliclonae TaxID=2081977 RepID=UPI0039F144ED
MTLLQRYFWTQALWPLLLSLAALAGLALLTQSLQTLDLVVENRQSAVTFLKITFLALPQLISIIMPLSVFMAALYALNRLNSDSELIVAKASGFSPWQIASPVIRLGAYALIAHLIINLVVQPLSFRQMRAEILKVRTDIASQMVQAGDFVTPSPGLTVYAREIGADSTLKDVMIYDARNPDSITTHMAKTGEVQRNPSQVTLSLRNGSVQQKLEDGSLDIIEFENYVVDLSDVMAMDNVLRLKTSDRFLHELLRPDPREFADRKFKRELAAEGHARLSAPLYNIALVLLALCFMVRGEHLRLGYGRRIAVCASLGFVIRLTGFGVASAAESDRWLNIIQYCLPLIVIAYCTFYLIKRKRVRSFGRAKRAREYAVQAAQAPDVAPDIPVGATG